MSRWRALSGPTLLAVGLALPLPALLTVLNLAMSPHAVIAASYADEDEDEAKNRIQVPSRLRIVNGQAELLLSRAAERNAGIATAPIGPRIGPGSVQAYGEVLDAAPLTELASRYQSAAAQLAAAHAKLTASQAELARARALYQDRQNVSAAQVQSAQSSAQSDQAALDAARASLTALSAAIAQGWGPVLAGAVMHDNALLRSISRRSAYLIAVTLPAGAAPASAAATASARLPTGDSIALQRVSASTSANPQLQGLRYYYRATATAGLIAGLNLPVTLAGGAATPAGLTVPESAVVWLQGRPWIYRLLPAPAAAAHAGSAGPAASAAAPRTFIREAIAPSGQASDGGYVVPTLPPDAQVVVQGAQLLLSEEYRAQVESQTAE
jgi:hypothetical protein